MLDKLLTGSGVVAKFVRHAVGIVSGALVGVGIVSAGDVDSLMKAIDAIFSNVETLVAAGGAVLAVLASFKEKIVAWIAGLKG